MKKDIGVDAAKLAGLMIDIMQKLRNGSITIDHLEMFACSRAKRDYLVNPFREAMSFELKVPNDYEHEKQLSRFASIVDMPVEEGVNDENFSRVSHRLAPGETYIVKIYLVEGAYSQQCVDFLISKGALLTGVQGLSLAWKKIKNFLPEDKTIVSFDLLKNFPYDEQIQDRLVEEAFLFNLTEDSTLVPYIAKKNEKMGTLVFSTHWNGWMLAFFKK
ncbi:MAG: hypothetical protein WC470_01355 [Candidatus Paceibacterota bacterium]